MVQRRTLQGGYGRAMTPGGTPNAPAWGITNSYLGGNPSSGFAPKQFPSPQKPQGTPSGGYGKNPGQTPPWNPWPMPGGGGPGGGGGGGAGGGGGQGGSGGGKGGGPRNGGGQANKPMGYQAMLKRLGLPLDPYFMAQQTALQNQRDSQIGEYRNAFQTGMADLDVNALRGTEDLQESFNDRGIFGSGLMSLASDRFNNDVASQRLNMIGQKKAGMLGVKSDYRSQLMASMMELARRLQGQDNLPLPNFGPWGNLGGGGGGGGGGGN